MLHNCSVLIVDDEEVMRDVLESLLVREGCRVRLAASGEEAIEAAEAESLDVAIVDVMLPDINGIEVLERLKGIDPELPVVMITAFGTAANTREAFKRGAFDFIEKPFKNDEVLVVLRNAVEQHRLVTENRTLRQSLKLQGHRFSELVGRSSRMQRVFELVTQAAPTRTTILIQGESGTGKELVARAIHAKSLRSDRPFITVNSGSLPPDLFESNLFGHVKGAFTGAVAPKKGLFELADRGSIFFDEIGIVPLETQAKLLRVIQEREFMRLGGVDTLKVDVRIIAATNIDLKELVDAGRFREDLYYRLHVITVELPGLRDRPEDIPLLAQHFLVKYGKENHKPGLDLSPAAIRLLERYHWPGNVR
ncbi:MAG: sigma-54-dependent Fis family transcriptional regulator, partial [Acidobacteria bacterium]|nr:sigma-54-dependent Fis family transcriptional regulator [Acidobacteriota bacterium]